MSKKNTAILNSIIEGQANTSPETVSLTDSLAFDEIGIKSKLLKLDQAVYFVRVNEQLGVTNQSNFQGKLLIAVPPLVLSQLGDPSFLSTYGVRFAYVAGAMAGGIASEEMVIASGKQQILSSFGTGGLDLTRIEAAINQIQQALPQQPYAFNLLHSPNEPARERSTVDLYLKYGVRVIEASAFMDITPNLVYYRVAGLKLNHDNQIEIHNKIIAKLSRSELATKFLQPAPVKILKELIEGGLITEAQAKLAAKVPMADDITVEADSGGHTDNRPQVCLLPSILELRDKLQEKYNYPQPVRIGVAGGIGTPHSALAAFMMGAAYIVTGSINQSCVEAGTSLHTKHLLAQAQMTDVMMAPAADMFEMGVKLQVLKQGTLFPLRAQKLFELYKTYNAIEDIPSSEKQKLEKQIFRQSFESIWQQTAAYLSQKNPQKLARANTDSKLKMALIFRWYLGLSSRWSSTGEPGREMDYQIWCGPAMGAFNDWVKDSYLAKPEQRRVGELAFHIMNGAAFLYRIQTLKMQGLQMSSFYSQYRPVPLTN